MYNTQDDERRRYDEQRREQQRREDEQRQERQRRDDEQRRLNEEAHWRKKDAERQQDEWLRSKKHDNEAMADRIQQEKDAGDREWDERRDNQARSTSSYPSYSAPSSSAPSPQASESSQGQARRDTGGEALGLLIWTLLVFTLPLMLIGAAAELLVTKFPKFSADPSFAGPVAKAFVQWTGDWPKALYEVLDKAFQSKSYGTLLLYCLITSVCIGLCKWLLARLFRLHWALGLTVSLGLASLVGLFIYVVVHFQR